MKCTHLIELVKTDGTVYDEPVYIAADFLCGSFTRDPYRAARIDDKATAKFVAELVNRLYPQEAHGSRWEAVEHGFD